MRCGCSHTFGKPTAWFKRDVRSDVDYLLTELSNRRTFCLLPKNLSTCFWCLPFTTPLVGFIASCSLWHQFTSTVWSYAWHINTHWEYERARFLSLDRAWTDWTNYWCVTMSQHKAKYGDVFVTIFVVGGGGWVASDTVHVTAASEAWIQHKPFEWTYLGLFFKVF